MVRGGAPDTKRVAGLPLVAAMGTAALLMMPQVQAFLPYSVRRPTMPQSTLMAAAGLLSRNPNAPSGLEAGQASSKASSVLEEGRAVVEEEMNAMAIPKLTAREEKAKDWFNNVMKTSPGTSSALWQAHAQIAMEVLSELRPPTRKDEAWRFTDLSRVYTKGHATSPLADPAATLDAQLVPLINAKVDEHMLDVCSGQVVVFVDGVFRKEVSRLDKMADAQGWQAGSIHDFQGEDLEGVMGLLRYTPEEGMRHTLSAGSVPFVSLNSACMTDAACLVTQPRAEMASPVQFVFVSTTSSSARVSHPRLLVLARKRSTARFVQTYIDLGEGSAMANAATTVYCERRSTVEHAHLNELGPKAALFDAVSVGTKKLASYKNVFVNVGAETARINFQATMNGTTSSVQTRGLTVSGEEQELDIHSFVHQLRKKGTSNMYQINIVSGDSHCVFKGRMKLEPKAREVKADQLIRSVMLTGTCTVDAMPTLEVSSGDVDCTHGATVADIDENQAFYLQSRGISRREARQVLMMGQAQEIYGSVPDPRLHKRLAKRLYDVCPQDEGLRSGYKYLSI